MLIDEKFARDVAKWHKKAMPNATHATQLLKLEEELDELDKAAGVYIKDPTRENRAEACQEVADVVLCGVVLEKRFKSKVGPAVVNGILEQMPWPLRHVVERYVIEKHEINKLRKWQEVKPGYYKHTED